MTKKVLTTLYQQLRFARFEKDGPTILRELKFLRNTVWIQKDRFSNRFRVNLGLSVRFPFHADPYPILSGHLGADRVYLYSADTTWWEMSKLDELVPLAKKLIPPWFDYYNDLELLHRLVQKGSIEKKSLAHLIEPSLTESCPFDARQIPPPFYLYLSLIAYYRGQLKEAIEQARKWREATRHDSKSTELLEWLTSEGVKRTIQ